MKTQKIAFRIVGGLVIALVQAVAFNVTAQATRQESTNQLKKAVYTFDPSQYPQMITQKKNVSGTCIMDDGLGHTSTQLYDYYRYYAVVSIPEITVSNMPSVEVWRIAPGSPPAPGAWWGPMPTVSVSWEWDTGPAFIVATNGVCFVLWKVETHPLAPLNGPWVWCTNVWAISNRVVVIYETPSGSNPFKLDVAQNPSGVSLTVPTTTGRRYAVQYTPVLPLTNSWNMLFSNIIGTGDPVSVMDSNRANQRFYRALEQ